MKPDIVLVVPIYAGAVEQLDREYTMHRLWEAKQRAQFLAEAKDRVRAIVTGPGRVDAELMDALPKTEIIATQSVGTDHIDLAAAKARNIPVTNTPDVLTDDVADLAMTLLLAVARRIVVGDRHVREGKWLKANLPLATKVGGARLGVVGLGRIGQAIATRAEAFGLKVVYYGPRAKPDARYRHYADLVAMAREVDYLVVSCPGGAATRNLVSAEVLSALGSKGVIVNISRGSVIDEPALVEMLSDGRLGGAGLDVFVDEPRVPERLFALDNVVLQPHVGSATHATRGAMGQLVIDNLRAHFAGKPLLTPV
ncbi:MAG TPA: 2-hydroxyacid dehydrogenase, partial [Stellaceae bacterium]|nr:2-hydroxyacid dehydrogenase [Stellaceae bacterium]